MRTIPILVLAGALLAAPALDAAPLTWDQARQQAQQGNPSLVSARQAVAVAQSGLTAADAGLWPSLSAVAGLNRSQTNALAGLPTLADGQSDWGSGYNGGLQASWTIFNGFGTLYGRSRALAGLAQAQAQEAATSAALLSSLRQAFNQLLYDQENGELLKGIAERYHQDTRYQELQFQSGHSARWEFLKSQSDEAQVKWDLEQSGLSSQADRAALAALMGQDPAQADGLTVEGELAAPAPPADDAADWARLQAINPALRVQRAVLAADEAAVGQADAAFYPSLSASGGYTYSGGDSWGPQQSLASAGLSLSFNLFGGGANAAARAQALATLDAGRKDLEAQVQQARAALRKAWAAYLSAYDRVPMDQMATAAGDERFKTVGALYNAGRAAYLDYEQAESIYTQAQQQELSARLAAAQAQAQYQAQLGVGFDDAQVSPAP